MTDSEVIHLARRCGVWQSSMGHVNLKSNSAILKFYSAITAREREACAIAVAGYPDCADAIRNRTTRQNLS